jgi:glycosyltransferase involved in cell wall biosynthesis
MNDNIDIVSHKHQLAIVIPAYKANYLSETLSSIANQTDKRFCVYIGDDCSSEDIGSIVTRYKGKFDYVYKRFETNLGGKDLVAQWERCIGMTKDEEWIWLFSDDDNMDEKCVEGFYRELEKNEGQELLRFNINVINSLGIIQSECLFPALVSSTYLFKNKLLGRINLFAVEYVFSRAVYVRTGGFQNFDLAWGSDTATWMKFGEKGIRTIPASRVQWRKSDENITGRRETKEGSLRKFRAFCIFLLWSYDFWKERHKNYQLFIDFIFIRGLHDIANDIPYTECIKASDSYLPKNGFRRVLLISLFRIYHFVGEIKSKISNLLR